MKHAAIVGWGKCMPPAILSNADLATFLDTSDEWILTRTGIRERRISHVPLAELIHVAAARALACAGIEGRQIELIVVGTTSYDDQCPNVASGLQRRIGADGCAAMDVNTACTSFMYSLSTATALIRTGVVKNALVVGAEVISPFMDWSDRNVAVLFGDGAAAVVLQAADSEEGLLAERLGCFGEAREILRNSPGCLVIDKREDGGYVTPYECVGEDATYISRIREDGTIENGLQMWVVSDNLRKGAALNAVQIAECLINRKLIQAKRRAA